MRQIRHTPLTLALQVSALTLAALAANSAYAETPYIGADVQYMSFTDYDKANLMAGQIRLGTNISQHIGAEVHFASALDSADYVYTTSAGVKQKAKVSVDYLASAFVKRQYALDSNITVYGLLGGAYMKAQRETDDFTFGGGSLAGGVGVEVKLNPQVSLGADYIMQEQSISSFNAGVRYYFK